MVIDRSITGPGISYLRVMAVNDVEEKSVVIDEDFFDEAGLELVFETEASR